MTFELLERKRQYNQFLKKKTNRPALYLIHKTRGPLEIYTIEKEPIKFSEKFKYTITTPLNEMSHTVIKSPHTGMYEQIFNFHEHLELILTEVEFLSRICTFTELQKDYPEFFI